MKISKSKIRSIIKEELSRVINDVRASSQISEGVHHPLVDMAINFAKDIGAPMALESMVARHGKANMEGALGLAIESGELTAAEADRATTALLQIQQTNASNSSPYDEAPYDDDEDIEVDWMDGEVPDDEDSYSQNEEDYS